MPRKTSATPRKQKARGSAASSPRFAQSLFVRWRNFRGFMDTDWVELAPVTTVIGPNNSGKTSLHAPVLLLKQSLDQSKTDAPLSLRGTLINLGRYEDCVRDHDATLTMSLGLKWFGPATRPPDPATLGRDAPAGVIVDFALRDGVLVLSRYVVEDVHGRLMLGRTRAVDGSYSLEGLEWVEREGRDASTSTVREGAFRGAIAKDRPQNFLFSGDSVFADALQAGDESADLNNGHADAATDPIVPSISPLAAWYLQVVGYVQERTTRILSQFDYLGPLRDAPKRSYEIPSSPVRAVGSRGEHTAEVFCTGSDAYRQKVNRWLGTIHPGLELRCDELTTGVVALTISSPTNIRANIADVGFGVGQVLPIAVAGLSEVSAPGESRSLVMEQPEVHLNPRVQSRLADLVVEIAREGKRAYVETHSEHFLMRLRTLVAEGFPAESVALYFVEHDQAGSHVRRIQMSGLGHVDSSDWPEGFFDEGLRSALELVDAQRSRLESKRSLDSKQRQHA